MKSLLKRYKINLIMFVLGFLGGYTYWYFVSCQTGSCFIWSVWYRSGLYGGLIGWLIGDIFKNNMIKTNSNE